MVLKRRGLPTFILFLFLLFLFQALEAEGVSGEGVAFSKGRLNDRNAEEDFIFVFTITIISDQEPEAPVELVVENRAYLMREVDSQDTNFSDGKVFHFERKFDPGPKFYFFRCGNQSTSASTFDVGEFTFLEQYHPDIVISMILFVVPVVYFLVLLNRMKRTTMTLSKELITLTRIRRGEGGMVLLILVIIGVLVSFQFGEDPILRSIDPEGGVRAGEDNDGIIVTISREAIQPSWGHGGDTFLFTVTITSAEEPQEPVEMYINDEPNMMREINPDDTNFSDGKDFYHRETVDEGGWVVFFKTGNFTSTTKTLTVLETRQAQYHYDVAGIMALFIIPVTVGVSIFKRMQKEMEDICRAISDLANSMSEKGQEK